MAADRRRGRIQATLPARYSSMVSEPLAAATSAHGDGLGSDQWNSGHSNDFRGETNSQSSADDDYGRDFFKKRQFYELGGRPSLLEGQCYSGNWRSDSQEKMKPWEANLRSEARRQGESIMRSVQLSCAARFSNGNGDLLQKVGAGSRFPADQRKMSAYVEGRHFQVTKEKAFGILDEMCEMIKRWRHEDDARRAAESTKMEQRPPATPHPTQSSFRGMKTEQNSASKFNSTTIWDAVDDDGEKDEEVWSSDDEDDEYDNGNISVEESDSEERADDLSVDIGVDSVGEVVFEGGVRRNADEKNIRTLVQADEAVAYGASLSPILSCKDDEKNVDEENKENVAIESMCKFMKKFWNVEEIRDAADVVVAATVVVLVVENVSDVVASARHEELIPSLVTRKKSRVEFYTCNSREGFMTVFDPGGSPCGKISSSIGLLARALIEEELVQPLHTLYSELRPLPIIVALLEQVYKARSTGVEYYVHLASPELPHAWKTQILVWFCWWEEYHGGVNGFQLMKRMREEDESTGVHKFLYGAFSIPKLKGLMQGKSDKVIQRREALCAGISDTRGKSTSDMILCVANTKLIRNGKEMILVLNVLYPTLMIYTTKAEFFQPSDSSVVDKRVQVFDSGCGAKEIPSIQISSGNQPWVDKAELAENTDGLAGVVSAGQKHDKLKNLQERNHIWEIVGKGVDDARALKRTIIGVAVIDDLGAARDIVEIVDTLSVLATTLMLCETNTKPALCDNLQFEVHLRNKNWTVFDCLRTFSLRSLSWLSEVLVGQRHGEGGSHGSQGVRLNLHIEIPKLDLEDKVNFKG